MFTQIAILFEVVADRRYRRMLSRLRLSAQPSLARHDGGRVNSEPVADPASHPLLAKISRVRGLTMVLIVVPLGIHCCCDAHSASAMGQEHRINHVRDVSGVPVRRGKAAFSSGCKSHPATAPAGSNRSSYGGDEIAEALRSAGHDLVTARVCRP
jgi:hypothetical protein